MRLHLLLANVIAVIAITGVISYEILADRERVLSDARSDVVKLRTALVEQTSQTFAALDVALSGIAEDVDTQALGRFPTFQALNNRQETLTPTFALFVIDEQGRLAATSRTRAPEPFEFSEEPMLEKHRGDPSLGIFVAPPRKGKVGYAKNEWIFNVSRRLNHPDGSFAGIVAAAVSVEYLTSFYDALRMGDEGVVGLAKDDGTIITRSPFSDAYVGKTMPQKARFREMLPGEDAGVNRTRSAADGIDRILAYSRIPDVPLVVYTAVSVNERLAGWRTRALVDGGIGLLAVLVIGGFSLFLGRRVREREQEREVRAGQLTKMTEISRSLHEAADLGTALQKTTDAARELVPCHQSVTSLTEHPSMAQAIHSVSLSDKYASWREFDETPDGSGIYRKVCETNRPMKMTQAELESHPDWKGFGAAKDRHPPMRGWLAVPLIAENGDNLGLIQLSDRKSGEFTAEDQALLVELARVTSTAIQKLKMTDELHEAVEASERLRTEADSARRDVESILTSITDAVYALDEHWCFTYLNPQAAKFLEREAEDLVGRNVWDEFPEVLDTVLYSEYHRARAENVDVEFRFYFLPLKRWFEVRAFPQKEGGLTVYFQDVSDWVDQEEQLRQAQKMQAVGQLTGGVAHDFNNLLTVILGNAETLLDDLSEDDAHYRLVSMIGDAAERAGDLTQRLLAFSRRQPLDPRDVEINALMAALEPLLRRTLGEHYDIRFVAPDRIARAMVDPAQLQNVIVNLAVNARDAMPEGGRLTIETVEVTIDGDYAESNIEAEPGHYVMIAVGDNGSGMPPEVRARAIEPFFTTKDVGKGTGLGLSMAYGFAKQSRGYLNIYSEPGEGTTVKLYLPCADADDAAEELGDEADAFQRGVERILVVEDDMLVREYTTSSLTALGYDVTAVADGAAATAVLEKDRSFDLLLCDVILAGGMNGREVADAARDRHPGLKVLFMSGYPESVVAHHGRLDADARLLQKPFRRADLARKIREALDEED